MADAVSVIVPAHNEARVIGRLLARLAPAAGPGGWLDVVVVANGCSDGTAEVAGAFGSAVRVVSLPEASKRAALDAGDRLARWFPRIYVDADVELGPDDIAALAAALERPGVLSAAPEATYPLAGRPWLVRWYYEVWTRLPEVRRGLFGRGVIGVNQRGHERLRTLPPVIADDLAASLAFGPHERMIAPGARVLVHPPRAVAGLLGRRVRSVVGTAQVEHADGAPAASARTRPSHLSAIALREPRMAPRVVVFLAVSALARLRAGQAIRQRRYSTWHRDESSRI
jgi:glycosyltransferase involved in cell wall biosynthesis